MIYLRGKTVLITGSGRGNGLAFSRAFVMAGATVIGVDLHHETKSGAERDYRADITNHSHMKKIIDEVEKDFGGIDGLICNAGISMSSQTPYSDYETFSRTMSVNLEANFFLMGSVCEVMSKKQCGSIVSITSLGAELAFPGNPAYQISKAGLRQLTKAVARDWGGKGIRANNLCPGYIHTEMTANSYRDENMNLARKNNTLLRRWGEPEDLVGTAKFLISDDSRYITGSDIYVDGGWMAYSGL
jgi:NAD(P)-dependent dehydrogenase (short-subunit alcohol dehydrogenase family)